MKLIYPFYFSLFILLFLGCQTTQTTVKSAIKTTNFEKIAAIKNVVRIEKRDIVSHFDENYEIWFEQPIDHNNLSKGTFKQRVFLGFEILCNQLL